MPLSRNEIFGECAEMSENAQKVEGLNDRAYLRLEKIQDFCEKNEKSGNPMHGESIIPGAEALAMTDTFRLLLCSQVLGEMDVEEEFSYELSDLRVNQALAAQVLNPSLRRLAVEGLEFLESLKEVISFNDFAYPKGTITKRTHKLPETHVNLHTLLTGVRQKGFRPMDPEVGKRISEVAWDMDVDYFVSASLGQSQTPFVFPEFLSERRILDGVNRMGMTAFRSENKADSSIITFPEFGPKVGHFSAIAGAGFGQLVEVDDNGEPYRHANIFMGPNNLYGGEKSVLKNTIEEGGFETERTYLVVEHQEGPVYAVGLPTAEQKNDMDDLPAWMRKNQNWVNTITERYGEQAMRTIVPGDISRRFPRQGQNVFLLANAIKQEALHCGLGEDHVIVDPTCPTTNEWNKHWSNTVETALFPGMFVPVDAELPKTNLLLWPRNGYFTCVE